MGTVISAGAAGRSLLPVTRRRHQMSILKRLILNERVLNERVNDTHLVFDMADNTMCPTSSAASAQGDSPALLLLRVAKNFVKFNY